MTAKTAHTFIARGTQKAAAAQVTGITATRSGTTATYTKAAHGLSSGYHLIQGFDIEEFNGVFNITVVDANTWTAPIVQDPGANPVATGTADPVVVGTALDLTLADSGEAEIIIQNGATGPTAAAEVWQGVSTDGTNYRWRPFAAGSIVAKELRSFIDTFPPGRMYVNYAIGKNTGQAVDCYALGSKYVG